MKTKKKFIWCPNIRWREGKEERREGVRAQRVIREID